MHIRMYTQGSRDRDSDREAEEAGEGRGGQQDRMALSASSVRVSLWILGWGLSVWLASLWDVGKLWVIITLFLFIILSASRKGRVSPSFPACCCDFALSLPLSFCVHVCVYACMFVYVRRDVCMYVCMYFVMY